MLTQQEQYAGMIAGLEAEGLSVDEIARRSGVGRSTVYRHRAGDARLPTHETVVRIKSVYESLRVPPVGQK